MRGAEETGPLQWGLIGIVALLALLIFATPGLIDVGSPPAGSPLVVAVLEVDRSPVANATHFYVHGLSEVRYARIDLGLSTRLSWPPPPTAANLTWTVWVNQTETLSVSTASGAGTLAVNVTAVYIDASGAMVSYVGLYAFNVSGPMLQIQSLSPGLDPGTSTLLLSQLPRSLPLLAVLGAPP